MTDCISALFMQESAENHGKTLANVLTYIYRADCISWLEGAERAQPA